MADVNEVVADPVRADRVNVARHLRSSSRRRAARASTEFVYASTIWVYGNAPGDASRSTRTARSCLPAHLYTATKLAGEMYCRSYAHMYGVAPTILRFGIPYGPRARPAAVVAAFVARAHAGEPLTIARRRHARRGSSSTSRISPRASSRRSQAERAGRIYNLVGDELVSVREIADTVRELVARRADRARARPRRPTSSACSISGERARDELGWRAHDELRRRRRRYVDWLTRDERLAELRRPPRASPGSAATVLRQEPGAL